MSTIPISQLLHDRIMLVVIHAILIVVLVTAVFRSIRARRRESGKAILTATVNRGDRSMTILYVGYGVGTVALSLAVQVAEAAIGHKVVIIMFDYAVLSYLFFFNSWFRNRLLRLLSRVYQD